MRPVGFFVCLFFKSRECNEPNVLKLEEVQLIVIKCKKQEIKPGPESLLPVCPRQASPAGDPSSLITKLKNLVRTACDTLSSAVNQCLLIGPLSGMNVSR